jgi:spore germination protein GerM
VNRRALWLAAALAAAALAVWWLWPSRPSGSPPEAEEAVDEVAPAAPLEVTLYFPDAGERLTGERREVARLADPEAQIQAVVEALLAGPRDPELLRPLPDGVTAGAVHVGEGGLVYLDLEAPGMPAPPAAGSLAEMQAVYSIVDTVLLNIGAAESVILLWNGAQRESFAGHLDTSRPLVADLDLVRRGG